jgi:hypothetical protein
VARGRQRRGERPPPCEARPRPDGSVCPGPRSHQVARVVREGDQDHQNEPDTGEDTDPQDGADCPLYVSHVLAPSAASPPRPKSAGARTRF